MDFVGGSYYGGYSVAVYGGAFFCFASPGDVPGFGWAVVDVADRCVDILGVLWVVFVGFAACVAGVVRVLVPVWGYFVAEDDDAVLVVYVGDFAFFFEGVFVGFVCGLLFDRRAAFDGRVVVFYGRVVIEGEGDVSGAGGAFGWLVACGVSVYVADSGDGGFGVDSDMCDGDVDGIVGGVGWVLSLYAGVVGGVFVGFFGGDFGVGDLFEVGLFEVVSFVGGLRVAFLCFLNGDLFYGRRGLFAGFDVSDGCGF